MPPGMLWHCMQRPTPVSNHPSIPAYPTWWAAGVSGSIVLQGAVLSYAVALLKGRLLLLLRVCLARIRLRVVAPAQPTGRHCGGCLIAGLWLLLLRLLALLLLLLLLLGGAARVIYRSVHPCVGRQWG